MNSGSHLELRRAGDMNDAGQAIILNLDRASQRRHNQAWRPIGPCVRLLPQWGCSPSGAGGLPGASHLDKLTGLPDSE